MLHALLRTTLRRTVGRAVLSLILGATTVAAQSLTAGRLEGVVRDSEGRAVFPAEVHAEDRASGATYETVTGRDGRFTFAALPDGQYDVAIEALGYIPVRHLNIRVGMGPVTRMEATIRPTQPPVTTVDTVQRRGEAGANGGWLMDRGYGDLVGRRRLAVDAAAFSTSADAYGVEGLPWRYAGVLVDGAQLNALAAPMGGGGDAAGLAIPIRSLASAQTGGLGYDVEIAGGGVGLRGNTMLGGRQLDVRSVAEGGASSYGASFMASGPLQGDTTRALLGVDYQYGERDLLSETDPRRDQRQAAWGRFDWRGSERLAISVRASGSRYTSVGTPEREGIPSFYRSDYEGTAGQAVLNIFGVIRPQLAHELRVAADFGSAIGTNRQDFRVDAATDVSLSGREANGAFDEAHATPRATGMLHAEFGAHRIKAGLSAASHRISSHFVRDADGVAAFGDFGWFGAIGAWRRVEATSYANEFRLEETALFVQDAWEVANGLSLQLGVRREATAIPAGSVQQSATLLALTGLDNTNVRRTRTGISPRVGVRWDLGANGAWVVEGGAGTYHDLPDVQDIAEALSLDVGAPVRYGTGILPIGTVPSLAEAPVVGTTISMLAPGFTGPRTQRVSFSVTHRDGVWTSSLSAVYRHTDYLTRRRDLNLPASPVGTDQYGRPLYGALEQHGSALVATPQSNRRFASLDGVHLLESTGYSDYWGLTAGVEFVQEDGLSTSAQYTYSRTTDNVPGFVGTRLSPFPNGLLARDWSDGTSDLDVPHRLLLAAEWKVRDRFRAGAVYRLRSGLPYTPGLRRGVDANGDGDWTNDPAYVDPLAPGMDSIINANACLRSTAGFAERNSCRDDFAHGLDLRIAATVGHLRVGRVEVVLDAVDVLASSVGALDRALLVVDPTGTLTTDPVTGVTTVPYVANRTFATRPVTKSPGIFWRLGLRITP